MVAAIIDYLILTFVKMTKWIYIPAAAVAFLALVVIFAYLPFFFKTYKIEVSKNAITVKHGVILKSTYIMPHPRMIYVYTFSTLVSRKLGLCGVVLKAARGFFLIPEMLKTDALVLLGVSAGGENE